MMNHIQILIFTALLISINGIAQSDTNYLYLDYLVLSFEDSTENLISLKFENGSDTLKFSNISECKMVGIKRNKECRLTLTTNKSKIILENINEYISFIDTKYRISINMPLNHSVCVETTYTQPDGFILLHSQTMATSCLKDCIRVEAGPTGYASFEKFEHNYILK